MSVALSWISAMLCYLMLCYDILCYLMLCYTILWCAILSYTMLWYSQATSLMWWTVRTESPRSLTFMPVRTAVNDDPYYYYTIVVVYTMMMMMLLLNDDDADYDMMMIMMSMISMVWLWSDGEWCDCAVWYIWAMNHHHLSIIIIISLSPCVSVYAWHDRQAELYQLPHFTLAVIR